MFPKTSPRHPRVSSLLLRTITCELLIVCRPHAHNQAVSADPATHLHQSGQLNTDVLVGEQSRLEAVSLAGNSVLSSCGEKPNSVKISDAVYYVP